MGQDALQDAGCALEEIGIRSREQNTFFAGRFIQEDVALVGFLEWDGVPMR